MSLRAAAVLVMLLTLCAPSRARAIGADWPFSDNPRFWVLGEGLGHVTLEGNYLNTSQNYDDSGAVTNPPLEGSTNLLNVKVHGGFGFTPRLSLFGQVDYRSLTEQNTGTGTPLSSTGFGDAFVGFRWLAYHSRSTDRVYPTEWAPRSVVGVIEGTWNFPIYQQATTGFPPIGDQSNDFSGMARLAWYANDWLALSGGAGYIYRTAGYTPALPWNVRVDLSAQQRHRWRFWAEFDGIQSIANNGAVLNSQQPDPIPNGSLLLKSHGPELRTAHLGAGFLASREWELSVDGSTTVGGVNAAKSWTLGLGLTWRPYEVPEVKYEEYRQRQVEVAQLERREFQRRKVVRIGFRATIVKVSAQGNYLKIRYGDQDRVRAGDPFYVFAPNSSFTDKDPRPVAFATVVKVLPDAAFLHVEERYQAKIVIRDGYDVRRVYFEGDD